MAQNVAKQNELLLDQQKEIRALLAKQIQEQAHSEFLTQQLQAERLHVEQLQAGKALARRRRSTPLTDATGEPDMSAELNQRNALQMDGAPKCTSLLSSTPGVVQ